MRPVLNYKAIWAKTAVKSCELRLQNSKARFVWAEVSLLCVQTDSEGWSLVLSFKIILQLSPVHRKLCPKSSSFVCRPHSSIPRSVPCVVVWVHTSRVVFIKVLGSVLSFDSSWDSLISWPHLSSFLLLRIGPCPGFYEPRHSLSPSLSPFLPTLLFSSLQMPSHLPVIRCYCLSRLGAVSSLNCPFFLWWADSLAMEGFIQVKSE